jgi:peptidyl-prolyl cis-trans isomerase C
MIADHATAQRVEAWLQATDPQLAERTIQAAATAGGGVADFVRTAVAAFVAEASDERWTQLISAAQGAEDAALAAVAQILRSKLEPEKRSFTVIRRV